MSHLLLLSLTTVAVGRPLTWPTESPASFLIRDVRWWRSRPFPRPAATQLLASGSDWTPTFGVAEGRWSVAPQINGSPNRTNNSDHGG